MNLWNRIKKLSIKQFFLLVINFVSRPLFFFPTHRATARTLAISKKLFGQKHHKNNSANAFRHALWNVLISLYCFKVSKSVEKSITWAEKITALHEKLAPNSELEMQMDLHNNEMGRILFLKLRLEKEKEDAIITILQDKMKTSKKVTNILEIENEKDEFVYIEA